MKLYPEPLQQLITLLQMLPGVGRKSAERFAFHLLSLPEEKLKQLGNAIGLLPQNITSCDVCGCLENEGICPFCSDPHRDQSSLCIIASPKDAFVIDHTGAFGGRYHVLGGLLSPLDDRGPGALRLQSLEKRLLEGHFEEMIIALDNTLEGDATALYLSEHLAKEGIKVSRPALGLPVGSALDLVDGGTLFRALAKRELF